MNHNFDDILFLLQCCIIHIENTAWDEFLQRFTPITKKSCRISDHNQRKDFLSWFPGWLIQAGKLPIAYRKLKTLIDNGELSTSDDQIEWFKSYFTHIVRSGVSAYFKELNMAIGKNTAVSLDNELGTSSTTLHNQIKDDRPTPPQQLQIEEDKVRLTNALSQLEPSYRVPFVLTCCHDFLTDEDVAWISDQCGYPPSQVESLIENELLLNTRKKYPLSAPFIGALINIGNDAVAQRVRRARVKLRELISVSSENGVSI